MLCPHLARQAAFYDVQAIWCKHDDPLYFISYPATYGPYHGGQRSRGQNPSMPPYFGPSHIARCGRSPAVVMSQFAGKGHKQRFPCFLGAVAAFAAWLRIHSSGTLIPHMEQVHTSQRTVTCDSRPQSPRLDGTQATSLTASSALFSLFTGCQSSALPNCGAVTRSVSTTTAMAWTTDAMRTAARIFSSLKPFSRSVFSCESTQVAQLLMADTTVAHSSKSRGSMPCVRITFMRNPARMVLYFSFEVRCRKR